MKQAGRWASRIIAACIRRCSEPCNLSNRALSGSRCWPKRITHSALPAEGAFRAWLLDPKLAGGGPLFDVASHRIDLFNYLFGKPTRVTAQLSNAVHQMAVEDNATVLIEYESGVRGMVDVRWHSKIERDQFRVIGTDGEINLDPLSRAELVHPGGRAHLPP